MRPIVFSTLVAGSLASTFNKYCNAFVIELFRSSDLWNCELGASRAIPSARVTKSATKTTTAVLMRLTTQTLAHDDEGLEEADVVLVGVSRSGKLPTSLYLAMQYGVKAANYPLIRKISNEASPLLWKTAKTRFSVCPFLPNVFLKSAASDAPTPNTLQIENCDIEVEEAQRMMDEGIKYLSSTSKSIEEISATILLELNIDPHMGM